MSRFSPSFCCLGILSFLVSSVGFAGGPLEVMGTILNGAVAKSQSRPYARIEGLDFHDGSLWRTEEQAIAQVDPASGQIKDAYVVDFNVFGDWWPEGITWHAGRLWFSVETDPNLRAGTFAGQQSKFAPTFSLPSAAWGLESTGDAGTLLATVDRGRALVEIDSSGVETRRLTLQWKGQDLDELDELEFDGTSVWVSRWHNEEAQLYRVDYASGLVVDRFTLEGFGKNISGIAYDGKSLWLGGREWDRIVQVKLPSR
jgi:glutamine cyclotransferase